jgi:hypothetical protein
VVLPGDAPLTQPVARVSPRWLRADAIGRALLAVAFGAAVIVFDLRLPALLIAAAVLATVSPRRAVLAWIALAGLFTLPLYQMRSAGVFFSTAYLCLLLAGAANDLLWQRRGWPLPSSLTAPFLALAAVAVVTGIYGALVYDPSVPGVHRFALVQVYATALIVLSAAAALLVAYRLEDVRAALAIVIGVGVCSGLASILMRPEGFGARWGIMLTAQAAALLYALLLRCPPRSFWLRSLSVAFILYTLIAYLALPLVARDKAQWVSVWIALVTSMAVISWTHFAKLRWRVMAPAALAVLVALWPYLRRAVERAQVEGDFGRVQVWADALRLWAMRPLLGVGPGNYSDYIERYASHVPYGSAHGNYQHVAAETGLLGIAAMLWVLAASFHLAWRVQRSADPFRASVALGVLGALSGQAAAAVVGDYLLPAYHNGGHTNICVTLYIWMLIGTLMAVAAQSNALPPSSTTR